MKDPEAYKQSGVFVSYDINYGKGYIKMFPAEHNKIFSGILLRNKITNYTQNK